MDVVFAGSSDTRSLHRRSCAFIMVAHCDLCRSSDTILSVLWAENAFVTIVFASICLGFGLRRHNVLAWENLALEIVQLIAALSRFQLSAALDAIWILIAWTSFAPNSLVKRPKYRYANAEKGEAHLCATPNDQIYRIICNRRTLAVFHSMDEWKQEGIQV